MLKISPKIMIYTIFISILLIILSIFIQRKAINAQPKITVYKATRNISVGETLAKNDVAPVKIDLTIDTSEYVTSQNDAVGKIAKENIYKGEYLNQNRLADKDDPNVFISKDEKRFSIPTNYIDDPYGLTLRAGDVVDIIFTDTQKKQDSAENSVRSEVVLSHAVVIGAIDENGNMLSSGNKKLATALLFQSTTSRILNITANQYKGKFRFVKYPDNEKSISNTSSDTYSDEASDPSSGIESSSSLDSETDTSSDTVSEEQ